MEHHLDELESGAEPRRSTMNAVEALYATGHSLLSRRHFAEAAPICRAMLACAPHDERGWLALGACHEGLLQHELALELYAVGGALSPRGVRCDLARARLFRAMGQIEEAEDAMSRARRRAETSDDHELLALVQKEARLS